MIEIKNRMQIMLNALRETQSAHSDDPKYVELISATIQLALSIGESLAAATESMRVGNYDEARRISAEIDAHGRALIATAQSLRDGATRANTMRWMAETDGGNR